MMDEHAAFSHWIAYHNDAQIAPQNPWFAGISVKIDSQYRDFMKLFGLLEEQSKPFKSTAIYNELSNCNNFHMKILYLRFLQSFLEVSI